jgi:hypothetical protein
MHCVVFVGDKAHLFGMFTQLWRVIENRTLIVVETDRWLYLEIVTFRRMGAAFKEAASFEMGIIFDFGDITRCLSWYLCLVAKHE